MPSQDISPPYFEVLTPLGVSVRTTFSHWQKIITIKHPIMAGQEQQVQATLKQPAEIRQSQSDPDVYLYYKPEPPYLTCVVVRHLNGDGFIITAYRTDKIKTGVLLWKT
jgi:hypothetical protein